MVSLLSTSRVIVFPVRVFTNICILFFVYDSYSMLRQYIYTSYMLIFLWKIRLKSKFCWNFYLLIFRGEKGHRCCFQRSQTQNCSLTTWRLDLDFRVGETPASSLIYNSDFVLLISGFELNFTLGLSPILYRLYFTSFFVLFFLKFCLNLISFSTDFKGAFFFIIIWYI